MNIKEKFTKITEMDVSLQGWDKTFDALNKEGRLDQKIMGKILQALCETTDEMYQEIKEMKEEHKSEAKGTDEPVQSP